MNNERIEFVLSFLASRLINGVKRPRRFRYSRILLIRLDEIGDMITTLPAIDALREEYPDADITLWCKPPSNQLFLHDPRIQRVVTGEAELSDSYDLIIEFRGNASTRKYAMAQRPRLRLDRGSIRLRQTLMDGQHPHEITTNLQLIAPVITAENPDLLPRLFINEVERDRARKFLQEHGIGTFAVFHVGAMKELKRWPLQKFADLAQRLHAEFAWDIVFVGGKEDVSQIKETQDLISFPTYSAAGQGTLLDYAALVSMSAAMVGNDSGPMHIAAATGVPVVGLFGPGEPHLFSPTGVRATYIHHKLECNPCDQVHCVHPEFPCMHRITVEEVTGALLRVVNE